MFISDTSSSGLSLIETVLVLNRAMTNNCA